VRVLRQALLRGRGDLDHVLPFSRGGRSSWGNTVTACWKRNQRKANRLPHEAGMKLLVEANLPRTRYLKMQGEASAAWRLWLEF
jgi:5-methylcytosine-specific restriction endonuclease McrA